MPLFAMRMGYRSMPLRNAKGLRIQLASVLLRFHVNDARTRTRAAGEADAGGGGAGKLKGDDKVLLICRTRAKAETL